MSQSIIYSESDLRVALYALLAKSDGRIEISFEEFGEAVMTQRLGQSAIAFERTADGVAVALARNPHATGIRS